MKCIEREYEYVYCFCFLWLLILYCLLEYSLGCDFVFEIGELVGCVGFCWEVLNCGVFMVLLVMDYVVGDFVVDGV